jgi:hypothetical protein
MSMSDNIIAALVGAAATIGAVLLAPIIGRAFKKRSTLSVVISTSNFAFPSTFIDLIDRKTTSDETVKDKESTKIFSKIRHFSCYLLIDIFNNGNITQENICLRLKHDQSFVSEFILNGQASPTQFTNFLEIGSLPPKTNCKVKVWCLDRYYRAVTVTSREHDGIKYTYNLDDDDKLLHRYFSKWAITNAAYGLLLAFATLTLLYGSVYLYKFIRP